MRASKITRSIAALRTTGPRSRAVSSLRPGSIGTQSSSSSLLSSSSPRNQHGRLISSPGAGSSQSMASRLLSTSSPARSSSGEIAIKSLSTDEYDDVSERDMEIMHENIETLCEDMPSGWEVEYSSGVMNLTTPSGTFVINKQPPNQQIWISSPLSGPARFGYSPEGVWVHHRRQGVSLGKLLDGELAKIIEEAGADEGVWQGTGLQ